MTDTTTPQIVTTTLSPRAVARAVNPAEVQRVQRLPHGSIIVHESTAPQAAPVVDAPKLEPEPPVEEPKKRARRLRVPVDVAPAPAPVELRSQDAALAEIRELLGLHTDAGPDDVVAATRSVVDAANRLWNEVKRDGFIPEHLTFPQAFMLGYALLDGCDTREVQTRLLDALAVSHGIFLLNREG